MICDDCDLFNHVQTNLQWKGCSKIQKLQKHVASSSVGASLDSLAARPVPSVIFCV